MHDTVPFNGEQLSLLQNLAFDWPLRLSQRLIVHTRAGRDRLVERGVPDGKVAVIPHGPLHLPPGQAETVDEGAAPLPLAPDGRITFVLFGEIKPYKGPDLMVEAVSRLPAAAARSGAGDHRRPPAHGSGAAAGPHRRAGPGVDASSCGRAGCPSPRWAELFALADCFVFPYRQIDASGVYFLTKALGKWLIASRVGIFAEEMQDGVQGALIPPEDVPALTEALAAAIDRRPRPAGTSADQSWTDIGRATRAAVRSGDGVIQAVRGPRRGAAGPAGSDRRTGGHGAGRLRRRAGRRRSGSPSASGYRLVKDWDFGTTIRDQDALRREFHTRYIYGNGTLDHLNDEWSRYRDNDNHVFTRARAWRWSPGRRRRRLPPARWTAACSARAGPGSTACSRSG